MKANLIIAIILLVIGAFYALLPHSIHINSGIGFNLSHGAHVLIGIILLIIGIVLLLAGRKKK